MIELNSANFVAEVVQKSEQIPVLVDFWADWCAPCKMLAPLLDRLAADYGDRLQIAKVNTDSERELAQQHGIRSLPTLHLYRGGQVVEELHGAQPEASLRALIENHLARPSDDSLKSAMERLAVGETAEALALLERALEEDPENPRLPLPLVRLYIEHGDTDKATQLLERQPREIRDSDQGKGLSLLLEFAGHGEATASDTLTARLQTDPADSQARLQLASRQLTGGDYDAALENFLELLRRDRDFAEGAAQRGLLALFALLGEDDPRVGAYRRKMFNLLH